MGTHTELVEVEAVDVCFPWEMNLPMFTLTDGEVGHYTRRIIHHAVTHVQRRDGVVGGVSQYHTTSPGTTRQQQHY